METMEQGDVIFRPSSKGEDRLTVTWKVAENVYQHIDIKEQGKINSFSLGRSLWIGNEEYEDLDEIMARFINPVNNELIFLPFQNNFLATLKYKLYKETKYISK
jgi:transcription elongation factor SPT6